MSNLIAVIPRNSREEIRIQWTECKNKLSLDIRHYFLNEEDEMTPTRKGVRLREDQISELATILNHILHG